MVEKSPHLDGDYAGFGKITEGIEVAHAIVAVKRDYNDKPKTPQVLKTVTVDTFGVEYPAPEKI